MEKDADKTLKLEKITVKTGVRAGGPVVTTAITCTQKTWRCKTQYCHATTAITC